MEKFHTISDTARQLSVEPHVLRYWEDELDLQIHRNAKRHRFYVNSDLALLQNIKELKEKGFQLKAIKLLLPDIKTVCTYDTQKLYRLREELNNRVLEESMSHSMEHSAQVMPLHPHATSLDASYSNDMPKAVDSSDKLQQFENILHQMISSALTDCIGDTKEEICEEVSTRLLKEIHYLSRQRQDLQEQQITLLNKILSEVREDLAETASSCENPIPAAKSRKEASAKSKRHKKLFAKSR